MRPLIRDQAPTIYDRDPNKRQVKQKLSPDFETADIKGSGSADLYGLWRGALIADWGKYCSYCEIPLGTSFQIEHKDPKAVAQNPFATTNWDNLLLACPTCNRIKGKRPDSTKGERLTDYLWPDGLPNSPANKVRFSPDPPLSAFVYTLHQGVAARLAQTDAHGAFSWQNLPAEDAVLVSTGNYQAAKAQKTIDLVGLNGGYDATQTRLDYSTEATDRRIKHRTKAWKYALNATRRLHTVNQACPGNTPPDIGARRALERQIISTAISAGFWSVWVTVFYQEQHANRLMLAPRDTIQTLLGRLFISGNKQLDLFFPSTDNTMIGVAALGDIPGVS